MSAHSDRNRLVYSEAAVAAAYLDDLDLLPPEREIFARYGAELAGAHVIDLGIGTGRTTGHLMPLCRSYVGIDYSETMLALARGRFAECDLRVMDAGDLAAFADSSFDIAVFSRNGVDAAAPAHRDRIFREVRRVLRDGGLFVFSTHNRATRIEAPHELVNLARPRGLAAGARALGRYLAGFWNAMRLRRFERRERNFALLVDCAHEYRLLHYYIRPADQIEQLLRHGFRFLECVGMSGAVHEPTKDSADPWLYYVARAAERANE